MIITENINSPLSIDDTNLRWQIDFNQPRIHLGLGYYSFEVLFWNEIEGREVDKNHRELRVPLNLSGWDQKFSMIDLQNLFYQTFPQLQLIQEQLRPGK